MCTYLYDKNIWWYTSKWHSLTAFTLTVCLFELDRRLAQSLGGRVPSEKQRPIKRRPPKPAVPLCSRRPSWRARSTAMSATSGAPLAASTLTSAATSTWKGAGASTKSPGTSSRACCKPKRQPLSQTTNLLSNTTQTWQR